MRIVNQRTELVPLGALKPHPRNANQGHIGLIGESIAHNGFYGSLVVQQSTGQILRGNHTWQAARQAGATEIPVTYVDVDDETALRILLVDNRATLEGVDDSNALAALLQELAATPAGLEGSGYDGDALDELLADLGQMQPELGSDPDAVPEGPEEPVSRPGDLWLLGEHRLLVGDSTDRGAVERWMAGRQAAMLWTDPPYGVNIAGGTKDPRNAGYRKGLSLANDNLSNEALEGLLRASLGHAHAVCQPGAPWYVAAPAGPLHNLFGAVLLDLGVWRQTITWVKNSFVFGRSDYHYRHEPIFYGWKDGAAHYFVDDQTQDSVWEIDRPSVSEEHPTMKPVELVARAVRNSSRAGAVVLDPFGGSGTTLIACEQEGRAARLMEIALHFADVIVRRWEEYTGRTAVREPASAAVEASDHARVSSGP